MVGLLGVRYTRWEWDSRKVPDVLAAVTFTFGLPIGVEIAALVDHGRIRMCRVSSIAGDASHPGGCYRK
jgi:hypothetical protein